MGMDPDSKEIIISDLTTNSVGSGDAQAGKRMMKNTPRSVRRVFGDGAYDGIEFRQEVENCGAESIVPPPRDAVLHSGTMDPAIKKRNDSILEIVGLGGDDEARRLWKILKGYHRRSLGETTMYRIKQLTGGSLRSREWERQSVESYVKLNAVFKLNIILINTNSISLEIIRDRFYITHKLK